MPEAFHALFKFVVPHSSMLRPKFFSIFVNDFAESISNGELYLFADDTPTIYTLGENIDDIRDSYTTIYFGSDGRSGGEGLR